MLSKGSSASLVGRVRFSVWLLVVVVLIASFVSAYQSVEKEASDSAYLVASKRIIETASFYKQKWLLDGQPEVVKVGSEMLTISQNGWMLPVDTQGNVDCEYWLRVLYPDRRILDSLPITITNLTEGYHYRCDYDYGMNRHLVIDLNYKNFSTKVVLVAE